MLSHPTQDSDIFAASMIGSWQWNIQQDRVNCDRTNARILGLTEFEATGGVPLSRIFDAVHPDDREYCRETTAPARERGGSVSILLRTVPKPTVIRQVILRGHYTPDTGFGRGVLIDITDQATHAMREGVGASLSRLDSLAEGSALCAAARDSADRVGSFRLQTLLEMALIEFSALMRR